MNRIEKHRSRNHAKGAKRVEVTVPEADAALVKALAQQLRSGSEDADRARRMLQALLKPPASTGAELIDFFRSAPRLPDDYDPARDTSEGRTADFD